MAIAFIGGGNMATALIGGMLARGAVVAEFRVVEPRGRGAGKDGRRAFPASRSTARPRAKPWPARRSSSSR